MTLPLPMGEGWGEGYEKILFIIKLSSHCSTSLYLILGK